MAECRQQHRRLRRADAAESFREPGQLRLCQLGPGQRASCVAALRERLGRVELAQQIAELHFVRRKQPAGNPVVSQRALPMRQRRRSAEPAQHSGSAFLLRLGQAQAHERLHGRWLQRSGGRVDRVEPSVGRGVDRRGRHRRERGQSRGFAMGNIGHGLGQLGLNRRCGGEFGQARGERLDVRR